MSSCRGSPGVRSAAQLPSEGTAFSSSSPVCLLPLLELWEVLPLHHVNSSLGALASNMFPPGQRLLGPELLAPTLCSLSSWLPLAVPACLCLDQKHSFPEHSPSSQGRRLSVMCKATFHLLPSECSYVLNCFFQKASVFQASERPGNR